MRHALNILLAALLALCLSCGKGSRPPSVLYVNPTTTTPQLAWLQAEPRLSNLLDGVERRQWRSQAQLQALLLAGKGDFWIGSLETMAKCRAKGAPVKLLAVTGWRKWSLIGARSPHGWSEALKAPAILTAPPDNPAATLLAGMLQAKGLPIPRFQFCEPKQLSLQMLASETSPALVASPMAEAILAQNHSLVRIAHLESVKAELFGGEARLPWAGVACNAETVPPEKAALLLEALLQADQALHTMTPEEIAGLWPAEYHQLVAPEKLRLSLEHDLLLLEPAASVRAEIETFLKLAGLPQETDWILEPEVN